MRTSTADAVLGTGRPVYFEGFPAGSTEDMLANAALCRMGELLFAPDVHVGDQVRGDPTSTRIQQRNWGYDHAWLAGARRSQIRAFVELYHRIKKHRAGIIAAG